MSSLPELLDDLSDLIIVACHRQERNDRGDPPPLNGHAHVTATASVEEEPPDLFQSFRIDDPLHISETKPLVERGVDGITDEPDLSDFQDESSMRQWLCEYQKKKIYVRPLIVYPSADVRALHEIYNSDDDKAVFDFIRFRAANLTANTGQSVWVQRQMDIASWTKNAHMLYRVVIDNRIKEIQRDIRVVHALMQQQGFTLTSGDTWHFLWCAEGVRLRLSQFREMVNGQKVNRFPGSHLITSPMFWANFSMDLKKFHELYVPAMFRLPDQLKQLKEFREKNRKYWMMIEKFASQSSPRAFQRIILQPLGNLPSKKDIGLAVATHLIDKPKLIMKRQVEIVMQVSVTCFDPLRCYIYDEGIVYLREPIHWPQTELHHGFANNTSAPKKIWGINDDDDVVPVEDHTCKVHRSWTWLKSLLRSKGLNADALQKEMRIQILKIIISLQPHVIKLMRCNVHRRDNCYEIFQFKYLLNRDLQPWLTSIRTPALKCISPIQLEVISGAIADSLNMIHIRPRGSIIIPKKKSHRPRPKSLRPSRNKTPTQLQHHVDMSTPSDLLIDNFSSVDSLQLEMGKAIFNECNLEEERKGGFVRLYPNPDYADLDEIFASLAK